MTFDIQKYTIPRRPGCYLYKDAKGVVVYVGKAKVLRQRVMSYFSQKNLDPKTRLLVSKIRDVEYITTQSEVEALILEQSLIHQYNPKFNIDLKGSIRYAYIHITNERFPRIVTSRKLVPGGDYFGPYTDGTARRDTIATLIKLFKIRTCVKLPKKVCLQYHLGNCEGPCEDLISHEEYMENIARAKRVLKGDIGGMVEELREQMKNASQDKRYERAKMLRDQITALELSVQKQTIDQAKSHDQDVINWVSHEGRVYIQIFNILKGVIASRHSFNFPISQEEMPDVIHHFYSIHPIPQEVIVPSYPHDMIESTQAYLTEMKRRKFALTRGGGVTFTIPQKGIKRDLLQLVANNIEVAAGYQPGVLELQQMLRLPNPPVAIDFFDISNLKNKYIVGASIRLTQGEYTKSKYRKFKIKTTQTQDDVTSMREVVGRRYRDALRKKEELPDLIVIDGGRAQLNVAVQALAEVQSTIPIISLAKREEEVYVPGLPAPLRLNQKQAGMKMLIKGRDEVHRFVLAYNRKLRSDIFKTKNSA